MELIQQNRHARRPDNRILFLDFDDVLNTERTLARGELFERANVKVLNTILDCTDLKIVITSTWRVASSPQELEEILVGAGVHAEGRVVGVTPSLEGSTRGAEIQAWLKETALAVSGYVILDNRSDMESCLQQLVRTDPRYGLASAQVEEVLSLIGGSVAV